MNVKKTIASIAAIAMVASTTSLAPLFTGISVSADGEVVGAENTDTLADTNAGISPLALPSENDEPEPEPIPVVIPSVYLVGGSTATTGTYTVTLEIEGASANTVTITVVVYGENVEFTRRADGKYTADIEITNENLEAFKEGFVIWTLDEKSYTVTKAEAVKKAEEESPEPEPIPVVTPDVYLIGGSTATTGTYTVTIEIEGASANTVKITVVVYGENVEFTRRADGKYTADIEITNENLEAFKKGFVIWALDEKSYTVTKAEAVIKAEEKPPIKAPDTPETPNTPVKPAPTPIVPYYPPVITNTLVNTSAGISAAAAASTPVQIAASPKSNITINAAETDVTPAMLEAFTKNRTAKNLTLSYSSKLKIVINKNDISGTYAKLDFSLSGKKFLPSKLIKNNKTLNSAEKIVQLDFVSEGDFGDVDKVTVRSRVGAKFAGKTAAVYEYADGKLVKVGKCKVGGSGLVNFKTDHFGQFVIAVE